MAGSTRIYQMSLVVCIAIVTGCVLLARAIETDFGRVDVRIVHIPDPSGVTLEGKLYVPESASVESPRPGVLSLHGFQNDKETQGAFAIELARRGFVVLALDQFGHGGSGGRMGLSEDDPTMGGDAGYQYLKSLPYVDSANLGVMGHSMGARTTLAVGEANPDHRALNPQCGTPGTPQLNNVLLTQARFEEFTSFRQLEPQVEGLTTDPARLGSFGLPGEIEWDVTYGEFENGSARRQTLIYTVHPGVTHHRKAVAETVNWMNQALNEGRMGGDWFDPEKQIFIWKELCTLLAMLVSLLSMIPLTNLLLATRYFAPIVQPVQDRYYASERPWRRYTIINNLISGLSYPLLMGLGGYLLAQYVPAMPLIIGNGVATWFLGNMLIYLVIFTIWYLRNRRKRNVKMHYMGISFHPERMMVNWALLGKTVLLGFLLLGWLYLQVSLSQRFLGIEFRFMWPFMRQFSAERFGYFWLYLIPALLFFLFNGGVFLFGQAHQQEYKSKTITLLVWWLNNCRAGLTGLALIWAFQYLPFFLGNAPGFELVGLPLFSGMIPLLLFVYIPQFIVLFFFLTWFYRRTGKVYLGALVVASLAMWWLTAGTAI